MIKGKRRFGCCLGVLLCCLVFAGLFCFAVGGGFCDFRFQSYREWYRENEQRIDEREEKWAIPMPHPESLNDAQSVLYQQYRGNFWGEEAYTLIACYDAAVYEQKKTELDQKLVFQTEAIEQYGDNTPTIEPAFVMDGFHMRFVKLGRQPYWLEFPEDICLIGTSDETCEIAYIYHDDVNLDSVSRPMEIELPELIHWSSVRWQECLPVLAKTWIPVM